MKDQKMEIREINDDDGAFISAHVNNGLFLLRHYGISVLKEVSPKNIAEGLAAWRQDNSLPRPAELDVIRALGCLFGDCAIKSKAGGRWVVVTDDFGQTIAVQNPVTQWLIYPLDAISKRTKTEPVVELVTVFDVYLSPPPNV